MPKRPYGEPKKSDQSTHSIDQILAAIEGKFTTREIRFLTEYFTSIASTREAANELLNLIIKNCIVKITGRQRKALRGYLSSTLGGAGNSELKGETADRIQKILDIFNPERRFKSFLAKPEVRAEIEEIKRWTEQDKQFPDQIAELSAEVAKLEETGKALLN